MRPAKQLIARLPITPELVDADPTLTEQQKAEVYESLFEYHGDEDDAA